MYRSILVATLCFALAPALCGAQEPPPAPPEEVEETEQEEAPPVEAPPAEVSEPGDKPAEASEEGDPAERVLTPEEIEIRRKAAEKAAKREARKEKRAEKAAAEEAKQAEKRAREAEKRMERTEELIGLGHASIGAGKYKDAQGQFDKARELEGGTSYDADMGIAHLALARGNYAEAVRFAQRAAAATLSGGRKAEALTFAGKATLASRPLIDDDPARPQPGTEIFVDAAYLFFVRAVEAAPLEATEAFARLNERFPPGEPDPRAARQLTSYLETVPDGEALHGRRVAAAYEALLSGQPAADRPVAVTGPISAPRRLSGERPQLVAREGASAKRRLAVGFVVRPDGTVASIEVLDKIKPAAMTRVRRALMNWTFEPARLPDGTPVTAYWLQGISVEPE